MLLSPHAVLGRARHAAAPLLVSLCLLGPSAQALALPAADDAVPASDTSEGGATPGQAELAATYGQLPLSFEPNQGQTDPAVDFLAHGSGVTLFLRGGEAVLSFHQPAAPSAPDGSATTNDGSRDQPPMILRVALDGAQPHPQAVGEDQLPGTANYLLGNDPSQWHTGIPTYTRVQYRDVYPGVDLAYYGNTRGQLEDDFVVAPGADPSRIRLSFPGADTVQLDSTGTLVVRTADGQVELQAPIAYQQVDAARVPVTAGYAVDDQQVGFALGSYDPAQPLIIDPVLAYATYLGGSGNDFGTSIAVDAAGNAYVAGATSSTNFPTTPGAVQSAPAASFVAKLNPTGTALVYSTYLGAAGQAVEQIAAGIAVDAAGDAYVDGYTSSPDFPTTPGAFQRTFPGGLQTFASELNPSGTALIYSTFLGGSSINVARAIALDPAGDAYVAGITGSADFPTTPGAFHTTGSGAFVSKLNPTGTALLYSTFLGGSNGSDVGGIAVDAAGDAYVTGTTRSADFPTTPGALPADGLGGFVSKLNPIGTALIYSTLGVGGNAIAVDAAGNAYVTGGTSSANFPTTPGVFQTTPHGSEDAFVSKLNAVGTALVYSTYLGGSGADVGDAIAVDSAGSAYVSGRATSSDFPTTPGALQTAGFGPFATKLNLTGTALVYSTYLGNLGGQLLRDAVAIDHAGNAYLTGDVQGGLPTTAGAFQPTLNGFHNAFAARISPGPPACQIQALLPGPPTQLQVLVHADRGLTGLTTTATSNTSVALPTFAPGTTGTFLVTATKVDQSVRSTFTLQASDLTGSVVDCDPALVSVGREPGDSPVQVIHHVARAESHVTITNGTPGVDSLRLQVDGHRFEVTGLHNGDKRTLNVSSAMRQASDNTLRVIAHGPRDSSALVLVSDS